MKKTQMRCFEKTMTDVRRQSPEPALDGAKNKLERASPRLSRTLRGLAAIVLAAILALAAMGFAPWTLSAQALTEKIATQIFAATGLYVAAKGQPRFVMLPRPHILLDGVALADPRAFATMDVQGLYGEVRLASLLTGRLEISRLTLFRPLIRLDPQKAPTLGYAPATIAASRRNAAGKGLTSLSLVDGRIALGGDSPEAIENLNATLEWPQPTSPATLTGEFDWRNERLSGLLWIARPDMLRQGDQTPLTVRLAGSSFQIEAEGMAQIGVAPRYGARIRASAPSLRQALALLDIFPPLPGPMANCEITATASLGPGELSLSQLRFVADGNEFEGSFSLSQEDERPHVRADLSARYLSLRPALDYLPSVSGLDGQWNRDNFELPDLSGADFDLRLRAAHARLSRLGVEDAELGVILRGGRLDADLVKAKAYKGALTAHATFATGGPKGVEAHAEAETTGIDAGALLWDAVAREDISGLLDATITLNATGESMAAMMRDLDGRATLNLTKGAIAGIDLTRAMSRLEKRPLASALVIRSGRSKIDEASAVVKIADGIASVEDGSASGPGFSVAFTGSTRVADKTLALRAQVAATDETGAPRSKSQQISFDLAGPWDDLSFVPDAKALIRRSGAAAPLLPPPTGD
jgi:AsmA protein